jgi:hypothetical protein
VAEPEPTTCTYDLDSDLRIVAVDQAWSLFALANDAPELVPPGGPIGLSALSCVADSTSALMFGRLFERVLQTGNRISFPIRCDAPDRRRSLELTITRREPSGLRVTTTLTGSEARRRVALLDRRHPRSEALLRMCGWCKLVEVEGRWCEVEEAIAALRLFEADAVPAVTHGMCPACTDRLLRELTPQ